MRVLVNGMTAAGTKTGVGHYTAQLLCGLRQQSGEEIASFPGPWLCRARAAAVWARSCLGPPRPRRRGPAGLRDRLAGALRGGAEMVLAAAVRAHCRRGIDLYHEPNFLPLPVDVPTVATFLDLSLLHPEWHPADRVAHFESRLHQALARCAHVLAISDFGRQEIIRTLGLSPDRVTRTYMCVRPGLAPLSEATVRPTLARLELPPHYLLYVGTIEPRKNVLTLLRAYCDLPAGLRRRYPLVLAGGWGWGAADVATYLDDTARDKGVRHLGYVADEDLPVLYNGARALAYPSLYEGFGLPPVEMLACGGAVLASTAAAVAETAGPKAHLIDPLDVAGWRKALRRVCADDDWWTQLRRGAVEAARPFTWERCAADTLRVYRALVDVAAPTRQLPRPRRAAG
jgi:alpha-1,3-rhamnosyl/mannosyltransferase